MPTAPIDVDRARADTPGCELVVHLNHVGGVSVSGRSSTTLDAERRRLPPLVRASVRNVTTDAELERLTGAVADLVAAALS